MARPKGSRDKDYDLRRQALIGLARTHLSNSGGRNASWRDLAGASGVSVSTMNHYFGNRSALIAAILEQAEQEGTAYLAMAASPALAFDGSIHELVGMLSVGLTHGVLALQIIGLGEGFADEHASAAYLGHHLEPMLDAIASRLQTHIARGEMAPVNPRFAAIRLLSPLLIAHLHQNALGGKAGYPMPLEAFASDHASAFIRAHRVGP